jgi:hypothetical protein
VASSVYNIHTKFHEYQSVGSKIEMVGTHTHTDSSGNLINILFILKKGMLAKN